MLFGALRADGPVTIDLTKVSYLDATMLTALTKASGSLQRALD